MEVCKDETEEDALVEKQEKHYKEVMEKIYESLNLFDDYQNRYKIFEAAHPDSDLVEKEAEEKASQEEEAETAAKVDNDGGSGNFAE